MKKFTFLLMLILTCLLTCGMLVSCSGDSASAGSASADSTATSGTVDTQVQGGGEYCTHSFGEWIVLEKPSCTDNGLQVRFCHYCGGKITMEIPSHGHTFAQATCSTPPTCTVCNAVEGTRLAHTPVEIPAVAQSCTKEGLTAGIKCAVCEAILQEQTAVPCHTPIVMEAVTATCENPGLTAGVKCSACEKILVAQIEISSHNPVFVQRVEPSCTSDGHTQGYECKDCKATISGKAPIPMLEHNYVDGKCTACKGDEPTQDAPAPSED